MTPPNAPQAPATERAHADPAPRPASAPGGPWRAWEDDIMRAHYPSGARAVITAGVNRAPNAIHWRANNVLGLGKQRNAKPRTRARLTPTQREHLARLANLHGGLLDQDDASVVVLNALARRRLAKHIGAGLWRVTLAGLLAHRENT